MRKPRLTPEEVLLFNAVTANFSTTEGSEAIFQYYVSKGLMSGDPLALKEGRGFEAFVNDLKTKISARKGKPKDILKEILGKNYKGIQLTITEKGEICIDHYKYGDTIPRPLEDYLTRLYGKDEVKAFKRAYNKSWADMSDAAQELFKKYGIRFDRGHYTANYRGGAKLFNSSLERAGPNQAHGALHRAMNNEAAQNLLTTGRSSNWLEDFFQHKLASDNLDVLGAKYLTPADFEAINKGADPNQLMLERLDQVERSGIKPNTNILAAELEGSEFDTLEQLDRHTRELRDRYIVEKGYDPQTSQRASAASIEKAQSNLKNFDSLTDAPKPRGQRALDQTIQNLHKKKTAPTLEKLPSQVVDTPTPTKPTPKTLTTTRQTELVSYQKEFVPLATSTEDANIMREWLQDQNIDGKYKTVVTEYGKGMGGVFSTIQSRTEQISQLLNPPGRIGLNKATRSLRTTDRAAQFAGVLATGETKDKVIAGTQFTVAQAIADPKVQAKLGKQLTKLVGKYGAERVAKLIPGVDILLSQIEAGNYMTEGRWDQATRAMVSGAIGWMPIVGDGGSAILDAQNTYNDIERLIRMHYDPNYDWEAEFERNPQLTSPKEAAAAMSKRQYVLTPSGFEWREPEITIEDRFQALDTDTPIPASILKEMDLERQQETFFKPKPEEDLQSRLQSNNNFLNTLVA